MEAIRDENRITGMLGTSVADGETPIVIAVNPLNNRLKAVEGAGANLPYKNAERDKNRIVTMWGVSSADGVTPIPIYADESNNLLIQTT